MKKAYLTDVQRFRLVAQITGILFILFAVYSLAQRQYILASAQFAAGIAFYVYISLALKRRRIETENCLKKVTADGVELPDDVMSSIPLPAAVCGADGSIQWSNAGFLQMLGVEDAYGHSISEYISDIKWADIIKCREGRQTVVFDSGRRFKVVWSMLRQGSEDKKQYSVFFYMRDVTEEHELREAYDNERIDVAAINIDNYDDFSQKTDDETLELAASKIRAALVAWAKRANAVIKKTDRDRYFMIFEHQYLKKYTDSNFDIVKTISDIAAEVKFPISISIGIGTGGSMSENETSARNALDLSLGRGGGQVCVKDDTSFKFYGGKNIEYERSTRVKARAVAAALDDFINGSDNVIIMGHRSADYDCFGAAVGLQRAVRQHGRRPYIVHDRISPAVNAMYKLLSENKEYDGIFVGEDEALEMVTPNTLLIVLDTHRPSMLPVPELTERIKKTVLIDHHRRSTEFISPCSLIYHEPYASSTCEMVTELLDYMNIGGSLNKLEVQCLYSGILLDTKNFMLKTGVRTFEAASYLRKLGLDTVAVRRMFSTSPDEYAMKAEIVKSAVMASDDIAIAKTYTPYKNMRSLASQAADDMLNLTNVTASVVVYPADGGTGFSARSIGTINVQLLMEKLGGGGHMTVSGAFIKGIGIDEGVMRTRAAVKSYMDDLKN